jgi:hypothetical protein
MGVTGSCYTYLTGDLEGYRENTDGAELKYTYPIW